MYVNEANIGFDRLAQADIYFSDTDLELTHDALAPLIPSFLQVRVADSCFRDGNGFNPNGLSFGIRRAGGLEAVYDAGRCNSA